MFENLDCIALRTVRYNDRQSILSVYTRTHGRVAMAIPAGAGRHASRLRAITQPMSAFQCVAEFRPNRDIITPRDIRILRPSPGTTPIKAAQSLFIADLLTSLLREPQEDAHLFEFLLATIDSIMQGGAAHTANIHLCFLLKLQHFMGIEPDWSTYTPGSIFDMADGIFRLSAPLHGKWLTSPEAEAAYRLRRMNFRTAHLYKMSRGDRNLVLDRLIMYYQIHFPGLGTINSLDVLRSLFSC